MLNASLLPVNAATGIGANDLGQTLLVDLEVELQKSRLLILSFLHVAVHSVASYAEVFRLNQAIHFNLVVLNIYPKDQRASHFAAYVRRRWPRAKVLLLGTGCGCVLMHGAVESMDSSFLRFGLGILLAVVLVYLILMAQFTSFIDPFIILMAVPPGFAGVIALLVITGSTLNVMSLMGVIMMVGIVVSNSILIVEFAGILHSRGASYRESVVQSCKIRLRPILMTSLATLLGMIPLALGLDARSEQYAPLARAIIGGLTVSVVVTVFLVPAVYMVVYGRRDKDGEQTDPPLLPEGGPA